MTIRSLRASIRDNAPASAPASWRVRSSTTIALLAPASRASSARRVFSTTDGLRPGSSVETTPTLQREERRHRERRRARVHQCLFEKGARIREGDDLHCRRHLARENALERRESRYGDAFVDSVDAVNRRRINDQDAASFGDEVAAAGEGVVDANVRAGEAARDGERRLILRSIVDLDFGDDDFDDACRVQRGDMIGADAFALFHVKARPADRMGQQRALGFCDRNRTESHAARPERAAREPRRSESMTSASMATAISAGLVAPMSKPIGA